MDCDVYELTGSARYSELNFENDADYVSGGSGCTDRTPLAGQFQAERPFDLQTDFFAISVDRLIL